MMDKLIPCLLGLLLVMNSLIACTGVNTFPMAARAGDTIALPIDRQTNISRDDVEIRITDSNQALTIIPNNDAKLRAWINMHSDPVSRLVVGRETNQTFGINANTFAGQLEFETNEEKDLFETMLFLDLPASLPTGSASIDIVSNGDSIFLDEPIVLEILQGVGTSNPFNIFENSLGLTPSRLKMLERAEHYTISFSGGAQVPAAIQVEFSHDPDRDITGDNNDGQAYVVNPRGDIKSTTWTDSGTNLLVLITSSWNKTPQDQTTTVTQQFGNLSNDEVLAWFKFYIAGGVTGLSVTSVSAFDNDGNQVTGVGAIIAP